MRITLPHRSAARPQHSTGTAARASRRRSFHQVGGASCQQAQACEVMRQYKHAFWQSHARQQNTVRPLARTRPRTWHRCSRGRFAPACCAAQSAWRRLSLATQPLRLPALLCGQRGSAAARSTIHPASQRSSCKFNAASAHFSRSSRLPHQPPPNTTLNRSANGRPPGPGRRYAVQCLRPGPGVLPSSPG